MRKLITIINVIDQYGTIKDKFIASRSKINSLSIWNTRKKKTTTKNAEWDLVSSSFACSSSSTNLFVFFFKNVNSEAVFELRSICIHTRKSSMFVWWCAFDLNTNDRVWNRTGWLEANAYGKPIDVYLISRWWRLEFCWLFFFSVFTSKWWLAWPTISIYFGAQKQIGILWIVRIEIDWMAIGPRVSLYSVWNRIEHRNYRFFFRFIDH